MAVSRALRRLLRIRELEEEQRRLALEAAARELRQLEAARAAARTGERHGRALVRDSALNGELAERVAGLEETEMAQRRGAMLAERIVDAQAATEERRSEFLIKRIERRQAETLVEEGAERARRDDEKRTQQVVDDWYGARFAGQDRGKKKADEKSATKSEGGSGKNLSGFAKE